MPRKRNPENNGLPKRWRYTRNAYYYQVPLGMEHHWDSKKTFRLGKTLPEAYREWADRLGMIDKANTIGDLLDRYALEVIPTKAPSTQKGNTLQIKQIREVFGHMPLTTLEPQHIYQYADKRIQKAKSIGGSGLVSARREVALLSHAYTKAVQWGYIKAHPFAGQIRIEGSKPRTRYVEDWEILESLSLPSARKRGSVVMIQAYISLKLLTGLRRGDLLRLKVADCKSDGIHVTTSKTGKAVIYEWTDELRETVEHVKAVRPIDLSPFLFCNKRGQGYINENNGTVSGWDSMWQRFMKRVLEETKVIERFTEHDLRAKCASDAETLEHAQKLLTHADSKITNAVYRRKPEKVKPLR